jgi:hypothetical protein
MKLNLLLGLFLFSYCTAQSQGMAVNSDGSTADASALLDIKSNTKGMLIPRMTKTEKNGITGAANGLMIFQTGPDSTGFHYYSGSQWVWISSSANAWQLSGNRGTNPASNFIGTTDNNPLVFRTQNAEAMRITSGGIFGIGTSTPNSTYGYARVELASEGFGAPTDLLIRNAANDAGYAPGLVFQHARGTLAAPLAVSNGDYLAAISTMNYDGVNYILSAGLDIYADGAITAGRIPTRLQFNTMNTIGGYAARLTIKNDGKVGIGTAAPSSTLQVDGTVAVGVTMGLAGGPIATPVSLANQKSYIGCSPADNTNNFYQLPDAASCTGRIYYIRNNSSSFFANIVSAGGIIFPGGSDTGAGGNTYALNPAISVKTVICISDGTNWTVGKID